MLTHNQRARLRQHFIGFVFQGFNLLRARAPPKMSSCR
jgi:ABC-type lipoprotein export system ATPase subunit